MEFNFHNRIEDGSNQRGFNPSFLLKLLPENPLMSLLQTYEDKILGRPIWGMLAIILCVSGVILGVAVAIAAAATAASGALFKNHFEVLVESETYLPLGMKLAAAVTSIQIAGGFLSVGCIFLLGTIFFSGAEASDRGDSQVLLGCLTCCFGIPMIMGLLVVANYIVPAYVVAAIADIEVSSVLVALGIMFGMGFVKSSILQPCVSLKANFSGNNESYKDNDADVEGKASCGPWLLSKAVDVATGIIIYIALVAGGRLAEVPGGLGASAIFGLVWGHLFIPALPALYPDAFTNITNSTGA